MRFASFLSLFVVTGSSGRALADKNPDVYLVDGKKLMTCPCSYSCGVDQSRRLSVGPPADGGL